MQIPFLSLKENIKRIEKPLLKKMQQWLKTERFILDDNVAEFEKQWAKFCKAKFCVGVSSGSDALYLALKALGIGPGDEVITQGNAYNASVVAIMRTGATPRFADIKATDLQIDPLQVAQKINRKTKAILVVHLYGIVSDLQSLKKFNIPIVEDAAQAHGTKLQGDIACFSFYPSKSLGCLGDGGAIVTNNNQYAEIITAMRHLGQSSKNKHKYFGSTMRLDPIQAIILLLQLPYLKKDLEERKKLAEYYDQLLDLKGGYIWSFEKKNYYPHIYPLFVYDPEELRKKLKDAGIETAKHYPLPVYKQHFYNLPIEDYCPLSERACETEISLPLYLGLTKKQQHYIIKYV